MKRRMLFLLCIILIVLSGCEKRADVKVEAPKESVVENTEDVNQPEETEPIETTEEEEPKKEETQESVKQEQKQEEKQEEKQEGKKSETKEPENKKEPANKKENTKKEDDSKKENSSVKDEKPKKQEPKKKVKSYNPEKVVSLATQKVKSGGKVLLTENLDQLLKEGSITKEEYEEYYPYDGAGYYSVYVETDLQKAQTTSGKPLQSVDAIAEHIADMLLLESGPYFLIEYAGVYTLNGTKFYEFRCYRA